VYDVDLACLGQRLEMAVDGREADRFAAPAEFGEQVVRRTKPVRVAKRRVYRLPLAGYSRPPPTERTGVERVVRLRWRGRHRTILAPADR
jgi:hypothetical protein